jgi:hypothetical protein
MEQAGVKWRKKSVFESYRSVTQKVQSTILKWSFLTNCWSIFD